MNNKNHSSRREKKRHKHLIEGHSQPSPPRNPSHPQAPFPPLFRHQSKQTFVAAKTGRSGERRGKKACSESGGVSISSCSQDESEVVSLSPPPLLPINQKEKSCGSGITKTEKDNIKTTAGEPTGQAKGPVRLLERGGRGGFRGRNGEQRDVVEKRGRIGNPEVRCDLDLLFRQRGLTTPEPRKRTK